MIESILVVTLIGLSVLRFSLHLFSQISHSRFGTLYNIDLLWIYYSYGKEKEKTPHKT